MERFPIREQPNLKWKHYFILISWHGMQHICFIYKSPNNQQQIKCKGQLFQVIQHCLFGILKALKNCAFKALWWWQKGSLGAREPLSFWPASGKHLTFTFQIYIANLHFSFRYTFSIYVFKQMMSGMLWVLATYGGFLTTPTDLEGEHSSYRYSSITILLSLHLVTHSKISNGDSFFPLWGVIKECMI